VRPSLPQRRASRSVEQVSDLATARRNERYLPGVELPRELKIRALGAREDQFARPDLVFLAVPSKGLGDALEELRVLGVSDDAGVVSLAKGLVPPDGLAPTIQMEALFGAERVACVGGPAHAREMVETGAGLVFASPCPPPRSRSASGRQSRRSRRCDCSPSRSTVPAWRRPSSARWHG
jgi:glycerol-3-phosphate dehydrogenase (NAD(P)+)